METPIFMETPITSWGKPQVSIPCRPTRKRSLLDSPRSRTSPQTRVAGVREPRRGGKSARNEGKTYLWHMRSGKKVWENMVKYICRTYEIWEFNMGTYGTHIEEICKNIGNIRQHLHENGGFIAGIMEPIDEWKIHCHVWSPKGRSW